MQAFDFNIKENLSPNSILYRLNEFGFVRICDFVSIDVLDILKKAFEIGLSANNYTYGYGKLARFNKLNNQLYPIEDFFQSTFFQSIIQKYWIKYTNVFQEYSFVHDFKYDPETVYGHLHFDRRHQLKFMVYLSDVDSTDHGAFSAIPKSHLLGQKLHEQSWKKALEVKPEVVNDIDELAMEVADNDARYRSIPLLLNEEDLLVNNFSKNDVFPVTGKAGTLIIFDTHVIHSGGHVRNNLERKVLRLHTFPVLQGGQTL